MTSSRRKVLLLMLLAVCAAMVVHDRLRPVPAAAAIVQPAARGSMAATPHVVPAASEEPRIATLRPRTDFAGGGPDAFAGVKPVVTAPALVIASTEPPPPAAPPLPYTVIGKKFERGNWEVYLAKSDASYIATAGAVLDSEYRIVEIAPPVMTLIYLPLNEKQTLQVGAPLNE